MPDSNVNAEIADIMNNTLIKADADIMSRVSGVLSPGPDALHDVFIGLSLTHVGRAFDILTKIGYPPEEVVETLCVLIRHDFTRMHEKKATDA